MFGDEFGSSNYLRNETLSKTPIYVVDTNVIVDYVDIICGREEDQPAEPTVDLSHAHIVVPTAVVRELSSFKKENSERAKAAQIALKRIRQLESRASSIGASYELCHSLLTPYNGDQRISVLPVHRDFEKSLPFHPADDDMDGQIILTALTAIFLEEGWPINGTYHGDLCYDLMATNVTLLTNDDCLAIRASERGIKTERYGYKYPDPYTGRRDLVVPKELFMEFYSWHKVSLEMWEQYMPDQPELVANEFIVMSLEDPADYPRDFDPKRDPFFYHIGRYDVSENAIVALKYVADFPVHLRNAGQAIYAEALMDRNFSAVICTGPAGSGKTYMSAVYGYRACMDGNYIGVTVVPCDSRSKLGALPGDLDEKMDPDVQPIKNALRNFLLKEDSKFRKEVEAVQAHRKGSRNGNGNGNSQSIKSRVENRADQIYNNWFSNIPIEHARGRDFAYELAIYDEFQDQSISQADTLIKRLGTEGKIVITGDVEQIHAPYIDATSNGLVYASRQLMGSEMVAQVHFTEEEVIRHPLVKMIAMRQKHRKAHTV